MRYHIIFENIGGKLDERFADTPETARDAAVEMLAGFNDLHGGDCVRIVEIEENAP